MSSTSEKCIDTNECQLNTHDCHPVAICSNFQGSFDCLCPFGYEGDGHGAVIGCEDVDECYENTHSCQENQFCVNQSGKSRVIRWPRNTVVPVSIGKGIIPPY